MKKTIALILTFILSFSLLTEGICVTVSAEDQSLNNIELIKQNTGTLTLAQLQNEMTPLVYNAKDGTALNYRFYLPSNYDSTKDYPLVVFLHGAGQRGSDNVSQTQLMLLDTFKQSNNLMANAIVIAPQCPAGQQWVDTPWANGNYSLDNVPESNELAAVVELVNSVNSKYSTDLKRQYVFGISMGGFGTWNLIMRHRDMFTAAVPVCGGADTSMAEHLKYFPIFTIHGDADPTVPVSGTREMVNAIRAVGGTDISYIELAGYTHNVWDYCARNTDAISWLFSNVKPTLYEAENNNYITTSKNFTTRESVHASNGEVLYTANGGAISATFTGTKFNLIVTKGPRLKTLFVSLDGGEYQRVETGATVGDVLERGYITGDLSYGTHTINILLEGQAHIDAFEVFNGSLVANTLPLNSAVTVEAADTRYVQKDINWQTVNDASCDNQKGIYASHIGNGGFRFYGSQFKINSETSYNNGTLYVSIDGGAEKAVSLAGAADGYSTVVYDSGILNQRVHTVTFRAEGSVCIDSIVVYGTPNDTYGCDKCGSLLSDIALICDCCDKKVSNMLSTYQDESSDFSIVNTSSLVGGELGVSSPTAYFYDPDSGTERKNGFYLKQPVKADVYGKEANWTVDAWVYISDVTSYFMIMQFVPQSGLSMYSVANSYKFNNYTENWAYRLAMTNSETGTGRVALNSGWNHLHIPLSNLLLGSTGNEHNKAAYTHISDMGGTIDGITFHENTAANYGTYDFAVASVKLVKNDTHTCAQPTLTGISVNTLPNTTVYTEGDTFSEDGLTVKTHYTDGSTQTVTSGFELSGYDMNTVGTQTVTVSYEGFTAEFDITVEAAQTVPELKNVEIESVIDDIIISNNWVKRYHKKFSGRYALHTTIGGKVQFSFVGDQFGIVSYRSTTYDKLYVSIDGGEEIIVDLTADKPDTYFMETVYTSDLLSYEQHVVTLRTDKKGLIDGLLISGEVVKCETPIKDNVRIEVENILNAAYTGNWSKTYAWKLSAHNAMKSSNGTVTFDFEGDMLSIISYKATTQGKMFVSIDGSDEIEVDLYDESTDTLYQEKVFTEYLDYGNHTVTIRISGNAIVDAIEINRNSAETVTYEAEDKQFELTGSWKAVETWSLSNHKALQGSNGASVSFSYTGYDFKVISYKATTQGKMYISIDGAAPIEVDLYDDSTDTKYKEIALDAAGLDYGTHTVEITTSGKVILDAIKIDGTLN